MEMWVWIAIAVALALLLVVLVVAFVRRSRRRRHLQETFGAEYDRAVADNGKRQHAEQELLEREQRHEEFELHSLTAAGRARLEEEWRTLQIRFLDDPEGATRAADGLVARVMEERGYPHSEDRDQRAADLSVEHPQAVSAYRRGWSLLDGVDGSARRDREPAPGDAELPHDVRGAARRARSTQRKSRVRSRGPATRNTPKGGRLRGRWRCGHLRASAVAAPVRCAP